MSRSIRTQLLYLIIGSVVLFGVIIVAIIWNDTIKTVNEMFDKRLQSEARMFVMVAKEEHRETRHAEGLVPTPPNSVGMNEVNVYESDMAMQVWISGILRARTEASPRFPEPSSQGFTNAVYEGAEWRVLYFLESFSSKMGGFVDIWVAVGEPVEHRQAIISRMLWQSSLPVIGIIILLLITLYFGAGRALKPLRKLRNQIVRRSPKSLKPVAAEEAPLELKPIANALNELLLKLEVALDKEKRFTADAAHELRTPLGALKAQAQVALRERDDESRDRALNKLIQSVDRASHLINQLLTLARIDPEDADYDKLDFELTPAIEEVLADLTPESLDRGIELKLENQFPNAIVWGEKVLIQIMLRNIVHNAVIYAPEQEGKVTIGVTEEGGNCRITVTDNGPGIPEGERSRVFDRFYRIPGTSAFGAGLGLSIVSRIARLHQSRLTLANRSSGSGLVFSFTLQTHGNSVGG